MSQKMTNEVAITWQITSRCNLHCPFCDIQRRYEGLRELSRKEIEDIINDFSELKYCKIFWSGGEPTLHPDLFYLTSIASASGIRVGMVTNGTTLNKVIDEILESGMRLVIVSLDGAKAETHDFHRGKRGVFLRVINGIKELTHEADGLLKVGINTVVTRYNLDELGEIIDLAAALEVDSVSISPVRGDERQLKDLFLQPTMAEKFVKVLEQKRDEYRDNMLIQTPSFYLEQMRRYIKREEGLPVPCVSGINYFHINPVGEVYPCYEYDYLHTGIQVQDSLYQTFITYQLREKFERFKQKYKELGIDPCSRCMVFYNLLYTVSGFRDLL